MNEEVPLEIDVQATKLAVASDTPPLLLDCREPHENEYCRIDGSTLIPMHQIPGRVSELLEHERNGVIVYCHHGVRSMNVVRWLRANGVPNAQSMAGGIDQWSLRIDPEVPRY